MKRVLDHIGVPGTCVAVLLLGCIGVFALVTGEDHVLSRFLTVENVMTILNAVALLGIVASGMAFVTYSGNLADLSVPSIMASPAASRWQRFLLDLPWRWFAVWLRA